MNGNSEELPLVLLVEGVHAEADDVLKSIGPIRIERKCGSPDRVWLEKEIKNAKLLGIRSRTQVDEKLFENAPNLIAVGCYCIGTNQVDLMCAQRRGIPVFNAPFGNTRSVAELTIASIIMLIRRIPEKMFAIHNGDWLKTADGAFEVRKKNLGIVGYGNIGTQLSVIASALGMHVFYYDIAPKLAHGNARRMDSLEDLLKMCHVITLHVPSNEQTKNMMTAERFAMMQPGSIFINQARGDLVDIQALTTVLKSGHLAGAAIDVFPQEPKSKTDTFYSPLIDCPNVLLTPHIGGSTAEAQAAIGHDCSIKLAKYLYQGATTLALNFPEVEPGPIRPGRNRLCVPHINAPGFLSRLNAAAGLVGLNCAAQVLQTHGELGYAVTDLEGHIPPDFLSKVEAIEGTISARIIFGPPKA
mmetsp:Transcript_20835/g.26991  ORF Transcript_20835/g.26991 Transcript_20835/m.26991 type:complete len:414 (+) Transcript_20835:93-1334(+)